MCACESTHAGARGGARRPAPCRRAGRTPATTTTSATAAAARGEAGGRAHPHHPRRHPLPAPGRRGGLRSLCCSSVPRPPSEGTPRAARSASRPRDPRHVVVLSFVVATLAAPTPARTHRDPVRVREWRPAATPTPRRRGALRAPRRPRRPRRLPLRDQPDLGLTAAFAAAGRRFARCRRRRRQGRRRRTAPPRGSGPHRRRRLADEAVIAPARCARPPQVPRRTHRATCVCVRACERGDGRDVGGQEASAAPSSPGHRRRDMWITSFPRH